MWLLRTEAKIALEINRHCSRHRSQHNAYLHVPARGHGSRHRVIPEARSLQLQCQAENS